MYLRSQTQKVQSQGQSQKVQVQSQKVQAQVQSVADRVKSDPRVAAKQSTEALSANASVEKESVVVKQTVGRVCHRYMLRSMRR